MLSMWAPISGLAPAKGCSLVLHSWYGRVWKGKKRHGWNTSSFVASSVLCSLTNYSSTSCSLEIMKTARLRFNEEVSYRNKDKDISIAKALLYVAAEDEAFMAFNKTVDEQACVKERESSPVPIESQLCSGGVKEISLSGKNTLGWLNELDIISEEVEANLLSRNSGSHLVDVLEAVNYVLFGTRGFKRFSVLVDPKLLYLHNVLASGCGSAIMLSILFMEICQRFGVSLVGSRIGEDFLIWPQAESLEGLLKDQLGRNIVAILNGRFIEDLKSKASNMHSNFLLGHDIANKREIIGIALATLIRLYWKRASRVNYGLMLSSPLREVHIGTGRTATSHISKAPLLRPQELRLAILASERLLILHPLNWSLRRDHGMLLYFGRRYGEAVQELSICMAFAPVEEAEVLQPFVEKLHLLRLESSWKTVEQKGPLAVP